MAIVLTAGWAPDGLTGAMHPLPAVMVIASLLLSGGSAALVRVRR